RLVRPELLAEAGIAEVQAPLPDVAVHVVEAERVRLLRPDLVRRPVRPPVELGVDTVRLHPRVVFQLLLRRVEGVRPRTPRPAGPRVARPSAPPASVAPPPGGEPPVANPPAGVQGNAGRTSVRGVVSVRGGGGRARSAGTTGGGGSPGLSSAWATAATTTST